ncbi:MULTISPECIES: HAD family hydrolase [Candidatus Protochlamydia]|uniref:HAD-IB family hydrolase n=1 Tax=Protochlamydia amoebophila (strain UWE25) TaxID=264201 RepID=Q6MBT4_PARUW|nr:MULTISPECIES: HAD family hydrolase [Protochlamydia]CAF23965.1 unnamed protein product [Candidatus Protochlamydia amoebophila UWE25]
MKLCVFDLDHTLLTVNSSYRFGTYLYQQKFISFFTLSHCLFYYARHKFLGMSMQKLHEKIFQKLFKGLYLKELQKHVKNFLDLELIKLFYEPALQRLQEAKQRGDYTLILSASPDFLVQPIAEKLDVKNWRASVYAPDQEGKLEYLSSILDGLNKANYVVSLINQMQIDYTAITAYSDSYLDLPILELSGKAVGVVPDNYLRKICQERGWEIL